MYKFFKIRIKNWISGKKDHCDKIERYKTEKLYFLLVKETLFYSAESITDDSFILNSDMIVLHVVKKIGQCVLKTQLVIILNVLQN